MLVLHSFETGKISRSPPAFVYGYISRKLKAKPIGVKAKRFMFARFHRLISREV